MLAYDRTMRLIVLALAALLSTQACSQSEELVRSRAVRDTAFARGVKDEAVLAALRSVPRERFVETTDLERAYADGPATSTSGFVVPSTYLVGLVVSLAKLEGDYRVLEYGTGTGYQAAVLAKQSAKVYSMDASAPAVNFARQQWAALGLDTIEARVGGLNDGWAAAAPFDVIVLWNAPPYIPTLLANQLQAGGRMIVVHGSVEAVKDVRVIEKRRDRSTTEHVVMPTAK